jgi:HEAT repeat protein
MSGHRFTAILSVFIITAFAWPATARLSKKQREELEGYAEKFAETKDPEARAAVTLLRGLVADRKERKKLEALKSDDDARVRLNAGLALVLAGDRKAPAYVAEEIGKQGGAFGLLRSAVAPLPDDDEEKIVRALLDGAKPNLTGEVFRYLAGQRGELFDIVIEALESDTASTRSVAAKSIVDAGRSDILKTTSGLLGDKDEGVRKEALHIVLAFSKEEQHVADAKKQLKKALSDDSAKIREAAARRLVELKDDSAAKTLLALANDAEEASEKAAILSFLVEHDVSPSMKDVEPFLGSEDAGVATRAHQLAAATNDEKFIGTLVDKYGSTEFDDRILAVRSVGYSDDPRALNVLQSSLFEARRDIRAAAAEGLVEYARPSGLGALKRALQGERDREIKLTVIEAIGAAGGKGALQILRFQVTNNDPEFKKQTIRAIRDVGLPKGAKALDVLLRDRNKEVQWQAFLATLALQPSAAKPMFDKVFRNPPKNFLDDIDELDSAERKLVYEYLLDDAGGTVRSRAAERAMERGQFGDKLYALATSVAVDSSLRRDLIYHFGNRAEKMDVAVLERIARGKDPSLAHLAAWMLTRHPSKSLEASYRGYLASKDGTLRAIAAYGLATVWK